MRGENCELSELFAPYSSPKELSRVYVFLLKNIPAIVFKLIAPPLALSVIYTVLDEYSQSFAGTEFELVFTGLRLVYFIPAILIILICMFLFGKNIRSFLYFCSGSDALNARRTGSFSFLRLRLSHFPLYLLSLLTFGILFIVYTIPMTVITYSLSLGLDNNLAENTDKEVTVIFNAVPQNAQQYENNGNTTVFEINNDDENN